LKGYLVAESENVLLICKESRRNKRCQEKTQRRAIKKGDEFI
jgi:hypothetical protein